MSRPVEYVRSDVISAAMEVFWAEGYESTSIQKLLNAAKLNRGSLYSAFGNKEGLFLEVLDCYVQQVVAQIRVTLWAIEDPVEAIRAFLENVCLEENDDVRSRGCLLFNSISELAHVNPPLAAEAERRAKPLTSLFERRLGEAQQRGLIDAAQSPAALADYLMALAAGLRMHAKMRSERRVLQGIIDVGLQALHNAEPRARKAH